MHPKLDLNYIKNDSIFKTQKIETSAEIINRVANILQEYVSTTLGPNGSTALINKKEGYPKITKDGVTVARSIRLNNIIENTILDIIVAVAITIVNTVGDGTTTSIIIATELYKQYYNLLMKKAQSDSEILNDKRIKIFEIIKTFNQLEGELIKRVNKIAKQIETKEDLNKIALLASNGDKELADMITEAFDIVGVDGGILIKRDLSLKESYLDFLTGYQLASGYYTHYFLKEHEQKLKVELRNAKVLIVNDNITNEN
jgi:chaperonin GroEL